jgi:hypothetical protein
VIAEDRMHAERRLQAGQHRRPFAGGNLAGDMAMAGDVIAEHHRDVRLQRVGALDDFLDALQRHPWIASVQVGDHRYPEREIRGPLRGRNVVARDAKPEDGFAEPVSRSRGTERAKRTGETQELTP